MQFDIDLNDYSGGPHWLSPAGKVDRVGIRAKHRAAYLSTRERVVKPARPETLAKLDAAITANNTRVYDNKVHEKGLADRLAGKDPHTRNIIALFAQATHIIDRTEPLIRDMIESDLMDVAGLDGAKVKGTVAAGKKLAAKIAVVRTRAIKDAFRYLREHLPSDI